MSSVITHREVFARLVDVEGLLLHDRHELDLEKLGEVDEDGEEDGRADVGHHPPPGLPGPHAVVVLDRVPNGPVPLQRKNDWKKMISVGRKRNKHLDLLTHL